MNEYDEKWEEKINALIDGELDPLGADELKAEATDDRELARAIVEAYQLQQAMEAVKVERAPASLRKKLKAIIPVHLFGQCAEMEQIMQVAEQYGLVVIEDAAQAIGSEYEFEDGSIKRAGSIGQYGCFSFFPSKNLGAFGDAGMVTTNDETIYERLKIMRVHGSKPKYYHDEVVRNGYCNGKETFAYVKNIMQRFERYSQFI